MELENELGAQMSAEAEAQLKLLDDPQVQQYIANMGARLAAAAREDVPEGIEFVTFFEKMERLDSGGGVPTFLLTHPEPGERLDNARERIAELDRVPTYDGRERYQRMVLSRLGARGEAK